MRGLLSRRLLIELAERTLTKSEPVWLPTAQDAPRNSALLYRGSSPEVRYAAAVPDAESDAMKITLPELSFVVLIGVSGSGKSTFARKHFKTTEILSSDYCRGLVSDDENSQAATKDAFEVLHFIARKRLAAGKLTVVDATNVQPESRKSLVEIAREFHCLPVAIVLDVPERVAHDRNKTRPDRDFGPHVIRQQSQQLHRSLRGLEREGFRHVFVLKSSGRNRGGHDRAAAFMEQSET